MNINKKVISIVFLGVGACLLSSFLNLYFSTKNQNNQHLLYQIQQLTGKAENLGLMSKNFIQNGNPDLWKKITRNIESLQLNLADVSPAGKGWEQKLDVIRKGITDYHHLMIRIHDPALQLNREKSKFQRIGLSFSLEIRERIIAPYRKEEGLTIYQGRAFDPVKIRIKETAYDLMALHIQQQLLLTQLLLDWDLAGYKQKKEQIAGELERHKTQLNYLNILMGGEPDIDNVIHSLKQRLDELVQYEQQIVKTFTELDDINRELAATGTGLVNDCADFSAEILSDISHAVKLNRSLNLALLVIILCILGLLGAVLARDIIHIVRDLEESREQHRSSEKTIKAVTDNIPGVVFQLKSEKTHEYSVDFISTKIAELFGIKSDSGNLFDKFSERIPEDERERYHRSILESMERVEPWTYEGRFITPDGEKIWFSGNSISRREGTSVIVNGLLMDITESKRNQEALRESQQLLANILESMDEVVGVYDQTCAYRLVNKKYEEISGKLRQEVIGRTPWEVFPELKNTESEQNIRNAMKGQVISSIETRTIAPDGTARWAKQSYSPLRDTNGRVIGVVAVGDDITRQKQSEEELHRLRNYLSNIINSMPSVLVGVDSQGMVTQWNHQAEVITGICSENAYAQPLDKVFPSLTHEMDRIQASIRDRRVITTPKVSRRYEQETRYEDVTIYPLVVNGVEGAVIRVDDVTERVRMEEMMIQSEKMLSVGGLAAGMAHEINNPLAGMMQTAQVMARRLRAGANIPANQKAAEAAGITMEAVEHFMKERGIEQMIKAITESGQRVSEIVNNMLTFARKDDVAVSTHHLGEILDKTIELAATDYDLKKEYDFKQIEITREYDDTLPAVPCQASKIQQVVLNILTNGAQAMQAAGTPNAGFIIRTYADPGRDMACMEIEDNGPGMDEKIRKHIFDPFFTTKPVGVGTGLGLSVSYFIITENHRGKMTVQSSPGAGAKFIIRLPLYKGRHQT